MAETNNTLQCEIKHSGFDHKDFSASADNIRAVRGRRRSVRTLIFSRLKIKSFFGCFSQQERLQPRLNKVREGEMSTEAQK